MRRGVSRRLTLKSGIHPARRRHWRRRPQLNATLARCACLTGGDAGDLGDQTSVEVTLTSKRFHANLPRQAWKVAETSKLRYERLGDAQMSPKTAKERKKKDQLDQLVVLVRVCWCCC